MHVRDGLTPATDATYPFVVERALPPELLGADPQCIQSEASNVRDDLLPTARQGYNQSGTEKSPRPFV